MRGKPLKSFKFAARGQRISAIACISTAGLLDVMTTKGTTDGETFAYFIRTYLLPHLRAIQWNKSSFRGNHGQLFYTPH